ncbi:Uncharacterized conserved protein, contains HEPN domain [Tangfeifania diversioriginum]|uniref:Uncharacterized conserved protein, contains HEPN domain n=1 Tax=Tangfeifania diversioriginum TaxID=1168035 RepID=A0A1M6NT41_9BACT|nr:DUF86 domain-containing protein [Tangfeifania diversioriginum]SHJ98814.1 Uncharacterized conserved protein, contains HEPN domain [Tangfeifania diversioriginum]
MSERDISLLLGDMLESALKIKRYVEGMDYESFISDEKSVDAVVRNFEIIGEAANRIDPDFKIRNPELEWKRIRGFRNRIIHEYFGIDFEIVWTIIEEDIDNLIDWLEVLVNEKNE